MAPPGPPPWIRHCVWHIDDGTLGGSVTQLLQDISTIQVEGPQIGLVSNVKKCEIVTSDPDIVSSIRRLLSAAIHIDPSDCTVLWAPVGGTCATDAVLSRKMEELWRLSDPLKLLSAHDAFYRLKNSFSLPKMVYTLRSASCYDNNVLKTYDVIIRSTLQSTILKP
jgi:hypothetical protein